MLSTVKNEALRLVRRRMSANMLVVACGRSVPKRVLVFQKKGGGRTRLYCPVLSRGSYLTKVLSQNLNCLNRPPPAVKMALRSVD